MSCKVTPYKKSLGDRANEIAQALSTAFPVLVENGAMEVPEDQLEQNNIGVYIIPEGRHLQPNVYKYLGTPAPVRTETGWALPRYDEPSRHAPTIRRAMRTLFSKSVGSIQPVKDNLLSPDFRSRELITINSARLPLDLEMPPAGASAMAHEVDHALRKREIYETTGEDVRNNARFRPLVTVLERSGHAVSGAISGTVYDPGCDVSAESFASQVDDSMSPRKMARILNNRARFISKEIAQPENITEKMLLWTILHDARARTATMMYGPEDRSGPATEDEVKAYQSLGLVHSNRDPASYLFIRKPKDLEKSTVAPQQPDAVGA